MQYQYLRNGSEDKYGLHDLQEKILSIMVDVDRFCQEHGVEYCLMGGSALGSARDLDIFMTPDQYEKFRDAFKREGDHEKYYLQEWGYSDGMVTIAKVRLNDTSYLEDNLKDWDIHQGIYIDIFLLHTCPNNRLSQLHQCFWAKYVIAKGVALRERERHHGIRSLAIKIVRLFPDRFLVKHGLKQVYRYRGKKTDYYCNFLGKAVFKKGIYKREWFDSPVYAPFEAVQLKVPGGLHDFLTQRFGDYMKPPSSDRVKYEQHAVSWDFGHQKMITPDYKDEVKLI